ncbi:MAG: glycerophosphodiester phosphodiesterase family protein [Sphingopyxis sp.]|nr:glycerophosphodiester phosphodiesterase family protein [Sphingopyxis sp.]
MKHYLSLALALLLAACTSMAPGSGADRIAALRSQFLDVRDPHVMVVAHRACWRAGAPENSLAAIEACAAIGADMIEIDVALSRDGVPILLHDPSLDRTTGGNGLARDHDLSDIRTLRLRAGAGGANAPFTQERVPTLAEALQAARGKFLINLDVKGDAYAPAFAVVERLGMQDQILMKMNAHADDPALVGAPFHGRTLFMPVILECAPGVLNGACAPSLPDEIASFARYEPAAYELVFTSEAFLAQLRGAANRRVWINALNPAFAAGMTDARAIEDPDGNWGRMIALGATVIQTDEPRRLIDYLEQRGRRGG